MRRLLLLGALLLGLARPAAAQQPGASVPLERFVQQVASLWSAGDAAALVEFFPARERVVLNTGSGTEAVSAHHAGAALRALFDAREGLGARPVRITLAGGSPPRGFGELAWTFRLRGAPTTQSRSVYVGAVWDGRTWRVSELRVMP
jgi:hypothetical protein